MTTSSHGRSRWTRELFIADPFHHRPRRGPCHEPNLRAAPLLDWARFIRPASPVGPGLYDTQVENTIGAAGVFQGECQLRTAPGRKMRSPDAQDLRAPPIVPRGLREALAEPRPAGDPSLVAVDWWRRRTRSRRRGSGDGPVVGRSAPARTPATVHLQFLAG